MFIIKDDKKENEKEEIIINGSGIEMNKDNNENNKIGIRRNSKNNKIGIKRNSKNNINNTVKLMYTRNNFSSLDSNNRKNKKMYKFNFIKKNNINNENNINIIKKNRNSDLFNFQKNYEKTQKYNPLLNNSKSKKGKYSSFFFSY